MSILNDLWPMLAATLAVLIIASLGLALGSFFGRPAVRGSCGGLASGTCACSAVKPPFCCDSSTSGMPMPTDSEDGTR